MLRQAIFTNARALRSVASAPVARTTSSLLRSQTQRAGALSTPLRSIGVASTRWYSADVKDDKAAEEGKQDAAPATNAAEEALKKQLEVKDKEVIDLKDKYLRTLAEFRTLQDRSARDQKAARDFAIHKFANDLLDSVDNLDRALRIVPEEQLVGENKSEHQQYLVSLYDGLKLTESILMQALQTHGIERIDPIGEKFNAADHEVTILVPHPTMEDNTVAGVESKGFKLHGRLLRPAKVQVAKKMNQS